MFKGISKARAEARSQQAVSTQHKRPNIPSNTAQFPANSFSKAASKVEQNSLSIQANRPIVSQPSATQASNTTLAAFIEAEENDFNFDLDDDLLDLLDNGGGLATRSLAPKNLTQTPLSGTNITKQASQQTNQPAALFAKGAQMPGHNSTEPVATAATTGQSLSGRSTSVSLQVENRADGTVKNAQKGDVAPQRRPLGRRDPTAFLQQAPNQSASPRDVAPQINKAGSSSLKGGAPPSASANVQQFRPPAMSPAPRPDNLSFNSKPAGTPPARVTSQRSQWSGQTSSAQPPNSRPQTPAPQNTKKLFNLRLEGTRSAGRTQSPLFNPAQRAGAFQPVPHIDSKITVRTLQRSNSDIAVPFPSQPQRPSQQGQDMGSQYGESPLPLPTPLYRGEGAETVSQLSARSPSVQPLEEFGKGNCPERRLPGPAGKLPMLTSEEKALMFSSKNASLLLKRIKRARAASDLGEGGGNKKVQTRLPPPPLSQNDDDFVCISWSNMTRVLSNYDVSASGIAATLRGSWEFKIPTLVVLIKELRKTDMDGAAIFKDPTGEMGGTIHKNVFDHFGEVICTGAVLELQKVSMLKPTGRSKYLNVTLSNIASIFTVNGHPPRLKREPLTTERPSAGSMLEDQSGIGSAPEAEVENYLDEDMDFLEMDFE